MSHATLVTGAGGFIGAWLTKALLERGSSVIALDRPTRTPQRHADREQRPGAIESRTLELLELDGEVTPAACALNDPDELTRVLQAHRVSTVFHLAAEPIVMAVRAAPRAAFETNVRGTWNVLEACRAAGVKRVIVASSDKAYGPSERLPYKEDAPLRPTAPYEASKAAADLIAHSYWPSYGLPVAVTRLANVYGGGDLNFSRLVPEAVCAALSGRSAALRSDGSPQRDFLYIDDAVDAYLAIAEHLDKAGVRGEAFNAGGGAAHRVSDVIELINEIVGVNLPPQISHHGTPDGEIDRQFVDATKLRRATGWQPAVSLEDGLRRTIDWYAEHPSARPAGQPLDPRNHVTA